MIRMQRRNKTTQCSSRASDMICSLHLHVDLWTSRTEQTRLRCTWSHEMLCHLFVLPRVKDEESLIDISFHSTTATTIQSTPIKSCYIQCLPTEETMAPPTQRATQKTIEGKVRTKESGAASCSLIYIAGSQSLTLSYPRCVRRIKERERWHPDSYRSLKISSFWLPGGDCEDAAQAQTLMW